MTAALMLALLCGTPTRPAPDPWFAPDKAKHFFSAAFLQSFTYSALRAGRVEHGTALAGATGVVLSIGIGKEVSDARRGGRASLRDMAWNVAGAGAAALVLQRVRR